MDGVNRPMQFAGLGRAGPGRSACTLLLLVFPLGCSAVGLPSPLRSLESSQVYQPLCYPGGDWHPFELAYEDAWFQSADGTRLHGWYVPCPHPRAVLLYAHGNGGNITHLADMLRVFSQRHRLDVMAFDYRGFGRSGGTPSEKGLVDDALAARTWLAARAGIPAGEIVLMGRSLGGGVALAVAANEPVRGLILESTFTSLPAVARHHAPYLPARLLMVNRFNSLARIQDYCGPLLVTHCDCDQIIPYRQGVQLFEAANQPKTLVTIRGGDHNDPHTEEFHRALDAFIASLPPISAIP
jgi:fermentation-respiration switch protein FrsA (DUF1100 family)